MSYSSSQSKEILLDDSKFSNQESEPEQSCEVCHSIPDSLIRLSCSHSVCIQCALNQFLQNAKEDQEASLLICPLCKRVTEMTEEVQQSLLEFINLQKQSNDLQSDHLSNDSHYEDNSIEIAEPQPSNRTSNRDFPL